jgi:hypothetical protein
VRIARPRSHVDRRPGVRAFGPPGVLVVVHRVTCNPLSLSQSEHGVVVRVGGSLALQSCSASEIAGESAASESAAGYGHCPPL